MLIQTGLLWWACWLVMTILASRHRRSGQGTAMMPSALHRPYPAVPRRQLAWLRDCRVAPHCWSGRQKGAGPLRLLSRVALAIGCSIVALCIDVLVNVVASRAWPWTVSLAVIIAAATVGVGVDPRVSRKFSRSFRVAYGEASVDDFAIAGIVNGLVEQITGLRPGHTDSAAAAQHLSQVLRQAGRVLLVIDGVWTQRQLLPFLVGAKLCVRLVTTRNQELLLENTTPVLVGPMSADQARELLSRGLPPDTVASLTESGILDLAVSGAWRWPLVLAILNKVLLARVREGRSPAEALRGIFDHVSVHGLRSADELRVAVAPEESELVRRALESGLALLNEG